MRTTHRFPCLRAVVAIVAAFSMANLDTLSSKAQNDQVFKVFGDRPVLNHGVSGSWNETYTDPGAVVYSIPSPKWRGKENGFLL